MIKKLINLKLEAEAEVIALESTNRLVVDYLASLGIVIGSKVMLVSKGIFGMTPCAVLIDNNENMIMLRASEANLVIVREIL
jgi:Fe2+ transport system protein FeoA